MADKGLRALRRAKEQAIPQLTVASGGGPVALLIHGRRDSAARFVTRKIPPSNGMKAFLLGLAGLAVRDAAIEQDIVPATFLSRIEPTSTYDARRGIVRSYLAGVLMRWVADHHCRQRREPFTGGVDEAIDGLDARVAFDPLRTVHPIDRSRAMQLPGAPSPCPPRTQNGAMRPLNDYEVGACPEAR